MRVNKLPETLGGDLISLRTLAERNDEILEDWVPTLAGQYRQGETPFSSLVCQS